MRVQLKTAKTASAHGVPHGVDRAFHAKSTLAVDSAELRFLDLPADLRAGFAQPGASYPTVVRFSNASGIPQADTEPDLRGVALRVQVSPDETHDLLMTNFPVSHARDANQFVEFANATAGAGISRLLGIVGLLRLFGLDETKRMLKNVMTARRRTVTSVATETYWSRGAMRWGPTLAVRYLLRPAPGTEPAPARPEGRPELPHERGDSPPASGRRPSRALHPEVRRRRVDPDRGHRSRVVGACLSSRAGGRAHHPGRRRQHRRCPRAGAGDRHDGLQPLEHDRRVPSARQPEPSAQGRL